MKTINTKRPSKLDLDAPLLSARRSNLAAMSSLQMSRSNSLNDSSYRVPFLWEQSPGKPKDNATKENVIENKAVPLPKPPPIHWQAEQSYDEGDEEDIGIDLFSLVGSLNTTSEREDVDDNDESDIDDEKNYGRLSPSFMIERFLPAAAALAASSLSGLPDDNKVKTIYRGSKVSSISKEGPAIPRVAAGEAYSSSKGCGLEVLFPWRVKHRVCGVKSPVREPRPRVKSDRIKEGQI